MVLATVKLGPPNTATCAPMRTAVTSLCRKLVDAADNPTYIFTEPRVGYRMPKDEGRVDATSV